MKRSTINPRAVAFGFALGILVLAVLFFGASCAGVKTIGAPRQAATTPATDRGEHTWMDEVAEHIPMIGGVILIAGIATGIWFAAVRWNGSRKRGKSASGAGRTVGSIPREPPATGAGTSPTTPSTEPSP